MFNKDIAMKFIMSEVKSLYPKLGEAMDSRGWEMDADKVEITLPPYWDIDLENKTVSGIVKFHLYEGDKALTCNVRAKYTDIDNDLLIVITSNVAWKHIHAGLSKVLTNKYPEGYSL